MALSYTSRRVICNVTLLQKDIELIALSLLAAYSPRAAARRLRKIEKRMDDVILDVVEHNTTQASFEAAAEVVMKKMANGNGHAEIPAQATLSL